MKIGAERSLEDGGTTGVITVLGFDVAADVFTVFAILFDNSIIIFSTLREAVRVFDRKLDGLFILHQPVQVLGVGRETRWLFEDGHAERRVLHVSVPWRHFGREVGVGYPAVPRRCAANAGRI